MGSQQPNALNTITAYKLQEIISLFTIAMKRLQDKMKNQIDAVVMQKCTVILIRFRMEEKILMWTAPIMHAMKS